MFSENSCCVKLPKDSRFFRFLQVEDTLLLFQKCIHATTNLITMNEVGNMLQGIVSLKKVMRKLLKSLKKNLRNRRKIYQMNLWRICWRYSRRNLQIYGTASEEIPEGKLQIITEGIHGKFSVGILREILKSIEGNTKRIPEGISRKNPTKFQEEFLK